MGTSCASHQTVSPPHRHGRKKETGQWGRIRQRLRGWDRRTIVFSVSVKEPFVIWKEAKLLNKPIYVLVFNLPLTKLRPPDHTHTHTHTACFLLFSHTTTASCSYAFIRSTASVPEQPINMNVSHRAGVWFDPSGLLQEHGSILRIRTVDMKDSWKRGRKQQQLQGNRACAFKYPVLSN